MGMIGKKYAGTAHAARRGRRGFELCSRALTLCYVPLQVSACVDPVLPGRAPARVSPSGEPGSVVVDVPYEPSPAPVVDAMLQLANVTERDVVYDLGCGDGRIVIAAVKERGARGVCIDLDPERIRESRENARRAGVEERISFRTQDLFDADLEGATVIMLFLWPEVNLRLRPKLQRELAPGARVVSHYHDMGDWRADQLVHVSARGRSRPVYLFSIPGGEAALSPRP
jgi:SAM-dependent methyltransferase